MKYNNVPNLLEYQHFVFLVTEDLFIHELFTFNKYNNFQTY